MTPQDLSRVFEASPDQYLILAPDFKIVEVSDAYLKQTMTKRDIIGHGVFEIFPDNPDEPGGPTGERNLTASLNSVLQNKTAHSMPIQRYDIRRPDGKWEERHWKPINSPVFNEAKEVAFIIHRVEDVTDQVRTQKKLKETQQRLNIMIDGVRDYAIIMLDPKGIILSWNKGAERIKGYNAKEAVGKNFSMFYTKKAIKEGYPSWELEQAKKDGAYEDKGWRVRKDGKQFWANVIFTPIYDDKHELQGYSKITRDLTVTKKMEDQLIAANKELSQFAYVASHDLKAPLRGISNLATWIEEDLNAIIQPATRKHLHQMRERIQKMNALIEGILQYSRIGRVYTDRIKIDLNALVADVLAGMDKKKFTFTTAPLPTVVGNETVLTQLFTNLLENTVRHHIRDDGNVGVTCEDKGDFYEFSVQDDGPGIPKNLQDKLFVMFQSLDPKSGGTGMGLALCKKIVEEVGCKIWVESDAGKGARFSFTWPKYLDERQSV
jgi:PAS domain S-box-containing protein